MESRFKKRVKRADSVRPVGTIFCTQFVVEACCAKGRPGRFLRAIVICLGASNYIQSWPNTREQSHGTRAAVTPKRKQQLELSCVIRRSFEDGPTMLS